MTSQWCHRNKTHSCYSELNYVQNLYFGFFIFWKLTELCRFVTYLSDDHCTSAVSMKKTVSLIVSSLNKKLIRRWDSERELSLRRHCTRTKNTIDACINSVTDRFLQHRFTKFSEITQSNGHYAVQGHSRSPILVPIESSYMTSY